MSKPRGAALILAMLVMLVLSGLGLIALYSVTDSVWQSGSYRARTQANLFSDSVLTFALYRAGDRAPEELRKLAYETEKRFEAAGNDQAQRVAALQRGGYHISSSSGDGAGQTNLSNLFEGGFFAADSAGGTTSFEKTPNSPSAYRYIIRDPMEGPSVEGYSSNFCFKKVTLASQARIGDFDANDSRNVVALGSNLVESWIGPVNCGSR
jgi:hypothetical protein